MKRIRRIQRNRPSLVSRMHIKPRKSKDIPLKAVNSDDLQKKVQNFLLDEFGRPEKMSLLQFVGEISKKKISFDVVIDKTWESDIRKGLAKYKETNIEGRTLVFSGIGYDDEEVLTCYFREK